MTNPKFKITPYLNLILHTVYHAGEEFIKVNSRKYSSEFDLEELIPLIIISFTISLFTFFKFTSRDSLFRLYVPRIKLEISKRNYIYNAIK